MAPESLIQSELVDTYRLAQAANNRLASSQTIDTVLRGSRAVSGVCCVGLVFGNRAIGFVAERGVFCRCALAHIRKPRPEPLVGLSIFKLQCMDFFHCDHWDTVVHRAADSVLRFGVDPVRQSREPVGQLLPECNPIGYRWRYDGRAETGNMLVPNLAIQASGFDETGSQPATGFCDSFVPLPPQENPVIF